MTTTTDELQWILQKLLQETPGARHALVLARDGLKLCHSTSLGLDEADHLAAIASGIQGLVRHASMEFGTGTGSARQAMAEFDGGILLIVEAGEGAHLAVVAEEDADEGLVGQNMNALVEKIGHHLRASAREPERPGAAT